MYPTSKIIKIIIYIYMVTKKRKDRPSPKNGSPSAKNLKQSSYIQSIKDYLTILFQSENSIQIKCNQKKNEEIFITISENSEYPFIQISLQYDCRLFSNNLMYIGGIHKSTSFSGNEIMDNLIRFARCFNYKKIKLEDASNLHTSDAKLKCSFSLAKYYLLSKNERWYSKFGFQRDEYFDSYEIPFASQEKDNLDPLLSNDEKNPMIYRTVTEHRSADFIREYEKKQFERINAVELNKFQFNPEDKKFIQDKLGAQYGEKTVHDLFDKIQKNRLNDKDICRIESIFKVLDEGIQIRDTNGRVTFIHTTLSGSDPDGDGGAHMILELPNSLFQYCYDNFQPVLDPFICNQTKTKLNVGRINLARGTKNRNKKKSKKVYYKKRKNTVKKRAKGKIVEVFRNKDLQVITNKIYILNKSKTQTNKIIYAIEYASKLLFKYLNDYREGDIKTPDQDLINMLKGKELYRSSDSPITYEEYYDLLSDELTILVDLHRQKSEELSRIEAKLEKLKKQVLTYKTKSKIHKNLQPIGNN